MFKTAEMWQWDLKTKESFTGLCIFFAVLGPYTLINNMAGCNYAFVICEMVLTGLVYKLLEFKQF